MSEQALDRPLAVASTKVDPNNRPPTGRTKRALDLMVHEGFTDNEAAVKIGITVTAIRLAIQRRGVRAYLNEQREVSRAHACARNIHRLVEIRDAANNMPALQAVRTLEQLGEADAIASGNVQRAPGVTVIVVQGAATQHATAPIRHQVIDNAEGET